MNANDYQAEARRTLIDAPDSTFNGTELMLMWCALGLGGEAGEVLDLLKKGICHQHGLDRLKIKEELGDLMWYVASIATLCEIDLGTILESNAAKLRQRYPNGYSSADSRARVDTIPDDKKQKVLCWNCEKPINTMLSYEFWVHGNRVDIGFCCLDYIRAQGYKETHVSQVARVDQQSFNLPWPAIGNQDTCKMCGKPIVYIGPDWDHLGEDKPHHLGTPVRYRI